MKLAISSAAFDRSLESGDLTQLEWLERCANTLDVDGVTFDLAHFPRRDRDYLAQLKKMAVDGGLTVAALEARGFFTEADDEARATLVTTAAALGAPLIVAPLPPQSEIPAAGYNETVRAGKLAARAAKAANVPLAIRNAPGTIGSNAIELKRFAKDVDSAWLRFALDSSFIGTEERRLLEGRFVIAYARDMAALGAHRGFVCLEYGGDDPDGELPALLERARRELFSGRQPHVPSAYPV
ncbi:MAG TPA: TIM barrel protein [Candidatus Binatia bacterium]|nr:TIM barrel protein [Candidatus Binatia bacterium]